MRDLHLHRGLNTWEFLLVSVSRRLVSKKNYSGQNHFSWVVECSGSCLAGSWVTLSVSPPADCSGAGLVLKPCSAPASLLTWFSLTAY